jgi:ATP-dependent RNA helicase DeaD
MNTFEALGLTEEVVRAVTEMGFEQPTPVQEKAIPQVLSSERDVVALAQTGTGKTAAFSLPLLSKLDISNKNIQVIVLSPTRELGLQIAQNVEEYSKYLKGFKVAAVYGGASIDNQIRQLRRGVQFVVGTPGRTLDLIRRKVLDLSHVQWVVLDEADEMLSMGFTEDLNSILKNTPDEKQTLLFSATMPKEIARISKNYMNDPVEISIGTKNVSATNVSHEFFMIQARDRYHALKRIVDVHPKIYGIIFCRTRQETKDIADNLMQEGYSADALHGDLSQGQRSYVMNRFRNRQLQLLVATDVAARGVDVDDLTHVLHYNLPDDPEVYIHRSGRTGRAGKSGISMILVNGREQYKIRQLENKISKKITKSLIPTGMEVCEKQLMSLIDKVESIEVDTAPIEALLPATYEKLEKFSREELIQRFVSMQFNSFLQYYKNAPDLNVSSRGRGDRDSGGRDRNDRGRDRGDRGRDRDRGGRRERGDGDRRERRSRDRGERGANSDYTRFKVNLGRKQGVSPKMLISLINKATPKLSVDIGEIDLYSNFSFFDASSQHQAELIGGMNQQEWDGAGVSIEVARAKSNDEGGEGDRGGDRGRDRSDRSDRKPRRGRGETSSRGGSNFAKRERRPKRPRK